MSTSTNPPTAPGEEPTSEATIIVQLLAEARAMIGSLQTQVREMRQQFFAATSNLELRLRAQETLHSALLYILAGLGVLGLICNAIALAAVAIVLFRILEALP